MKNSAEIRKKDLRPLKAFKEDYPESSGLILYRGSSRLLIDDIQCLPVEDFLLDLVPGKRLLVN